MYAIRSYYASGNFIIRQIGTPFGDTSVTVPAASFSGIVRFDLADGDDQFTFDREAESEEMQRQEERE